MTYGRAVRIFVCFLSLYWLSACTVYVVDEERVRFKSFEHPDTFDSAPYTAAVQYRQYVCTENYIGGQWKQDCFYSPHIPWYTEYQHTERKLRTCYPELRRGRVHDKCKWGEWEEI